MSNYEDNTTDERDPVHNPSKDSDAQNMPSANAFASMFTAALAPVLSQLTDLNDSNDNGETAPNEGPFKSAEIDADLSEFLTSAGRRQ